MEVIEKITKLMKELFVSADDQKTTAGAIDPLREMLKSKDFIPAICCGPDDCGGVMSSQGLTYNLTT